jgi:hypothetical protein
VDTPGLRPLGVGEILDVAFKIYTRHAAQLFKIVLFVVLPIQALGAVILISTVNDPDAVTGFGEVNTQSDAEIAGNVAGQVTSGILGGLAVLLATAACTKAVADAYLRRHPDWRESLRAARGKFWSLLWLSFLYGVLLVFAFVALIIPGIWLFVAWVAAYPVLMLEGLRGRKALGRSFRLVRGRWWPTFGAYAIASLLAGGIQFVISAIMAGLLVAGANDSVVATVLVTGTANSISGILTTPFQAAVATLIYFDLRVRKEGLDIELLAQNLGVEPPEGPALGHEPPPPPRPLAGQPDLPAAGPEAVRPPE